MKILFGMTLTTLILSGCSAIERTMRAIEYNNQAIEMSTVAITENAQAIEEANNVIDENRRQLERINKELRSVGNGT